MNQEPQIQRLDTMSKILLATSTINYMSLALDGVVSNYHTLIQNYKDDSSSLLDTLKSSVEEQQKQMDTTLESLKNIITELGGYLEAKDIVCEIDSRVYNAPLEILLQGKDEVYE